MGGDVLEVEITIDGKEISLNDFVQSIIGDGITGAISSLHGLDQNWKHASISIHR